jgi:ElaB/YqjD/DUF883 family membrane-anchored ribosome-binding protein
MSNDKITSTRETLIKDTDHLRQDAGQIVEDVKKHASAHVDAVRAKANNALDLAHDYAKEHPFHFAAVAFFIGFLIGFRRK